MTSLNPPHIAPPFGRYAHGIVTEANGHMLVTSGQLGMSVDGTIPTTVTAQADICFGNIAAILEDAGAGPAQIIRLNAYVTDRSYFPEYMAARDRFLAGVTTLPASTLMIVSGFTKSEFLVEVEATAFIPRGSGSK